MTEFNLIFVSIYSVCSSTPLKQGIIFDGRRKSRYIILVFQK